MQHYALNTSQNMQKITLHSFSGERPIQQEMEQAIPPKAYTLPTNPVPLDPLPPVTRCIFVIDNSVTIRTLAETSLREAGYEAWSFQSGLDAMHWLVTPGAKRPDLIFVDSNLPGTDGYKVIHAFKSNPGFARTICILLSQGEGTVDRFKGKLAGIQSYMAKPFTPQVLLRVTRISLASVPPIEPAL